jgi:hypothetical protein
MHGENTTDQQRKSVPCVDDDPAPEPAGPHLAVWPANKLTA